MTFDLITVDRRTSTARSKLLAWYDVTPYKKPSDYVWHSARSSETGNRQKDVVTHIFAIHFLRCLGQRGGCQGGTRAFAALNSKDDVGHVHTSAESAEASGPKQGGRHDPLETKLYRRCTASFWGNPGNSLIRFGVPDGI